MPYAMAGTSNNGARIRIADMTSNRQPTSSSSAFTASKNMIRLVVVSVIHKASMSGISSIVRIVLIDSATATIGNNMPSSLAVSTAVL